MIAAEQQCFWIQVQLRLKQDSKVLLSAPSDEEWDQAWIVPLGGIAELGYQFEWKNTQCTLSDEEGRDLSAAIHHGCPMVPREVGRAMIGRLEQQQIRLLRKAHLLKSMLTNPSIEMMQSVQHSTEIALTYKLKKMFGALPDEVLMRVVPDLSNLQSLDGNLLPWNRKKRRRLERAKQIVLHLFSGPDSKYWEKTLQRGNVEVLRIDLHAEIAADLHDNQSLSVLAVPCGLRPSQGHHRRSSLPNGISSEILRTEEHPYGLPTLSSSEQALVIGDSVLLFRTLALYMLCEDVRQEHEPQIALPVEQPEDPAQYRPKEMYKKRSSCHLENSSMEGLCSSLQHQDAPCRPRSYGSCEKETRHTGSGSS